MTTGKCTYCTVCTQRHASSTQPESCTPNTTQITPNILPGAEVNWLTTANLNRLVDNVNLTGSFQLDNRNRVLQSPCIFKTLPSIVGNLSLHFALKGVSTCIPSIADPCSILETGFMACVQLHCTLHCNVCKSRDKLGNIRIPTKLCRYVQVFVL